MNGNVENLMLEHLKRFQAGQDRIDSLVLDIKRSIERIERHLESGRS